MEQVQLIKKLFILIVNATNEYEVNVPGREEKST